MSTVTGFLKLGIGGAAIWCASDLAQSGFFSWLAADSTSISTQQAAQYADVFALATGVYAVMALEGACILSPIGMFYIAFASTGSTLFSKKAYQILD
jgi:hypothetical protein